jgi:hypothetical protein
VPGPYSSPTSVILWLHFSDALDCGEAASKADLVRGAAQSTDAAQNGFQGLARLATQFWLCPRAEVSPR